MMPPYITRVLIVEDNPVDVTLLTHALKSVKGWALETVIARDGEEAIDFLLHPEREKPDFVILDMNLPKRDGIDVLRVLHIADHLYGLPVVVFSSSPPDVVENKIKKANLRATPCLTKPIGLDTFLAIGPTLRQVYETARN